MSIAPEYLLRAQLVQILYAIPSERRLCEHLEYNLLVRWFVGLPLSEPVWHPTTFTKNRDRLLGAEVAEVFFQHIRTEAEARRLLSREHFSCDGTLLEAAALGLLAKERERRRDGGRLTVGADRGCNTKSFVRGTRALHVTPHVAEKKRYSAIDQRTTTWEGYRVSMRRRKIVEEAFGWMKTVGGLRKLRHRGEEKVRAVFTFTCACFNLVRLRNLEGELSLG